MPIFRSTGATAKERPITGNAVAMTVPSSCSMNNAPATSSAMIELCRNWSMMRVPWIGGSKRDASMCLNRRPPARAQSP